jgi:hypothetical protein
MLAITTFLLVGMMQFAGSDGPAPGQGPDPGKIRAFNMAKTVCDGRGGFTWVWIQKPAACEECFAAHEEDHVAFFREFLPNACRGRLPGANPHATREARFETECRAFQASLQCLIAMRALDSTDTNAAFLKQNILHHERAISHFCGNLNIAERKKADGAAESPAPAR